MREKRNKIMKKTTRMLILVLAVGLVSMGFVGAFVTNYVLNEDMSIEDAIERTLKWNRVSATNISVGNGLTGIVNVMTYTHQASAYPLYDDALNEDNAYEHMDGTPTCAEELEHTTPHSTLFDFVVIIQWDYDHAYNTSSTTWEKDLVKVFINISSTDGEIDAVSSEVMLEGDFYDIDGVNDAFMNCYVVGTGGFDLGQNVKFTIDDIKLYYWG